MMMNNNLNNGQKIALGLFSVVLIIIGLTSFFPNQSNNQKAPATQSSPSPEASPALETSGMPETSPEEQSETGTWPVLSTATFSFRYPEGSLAESSQTDSFVRFMGQKQIDSGRTQTELFDGFIFRIEPIPVDSDSILEQVAETERKNSQANCTTDAGQVSALNPVIIDGLNAHQFSAVGCSDYTLTIVKSGTITYRITALYIGEDVDRPNYKKTTEQILSTVKFVQ